MNGVIAENTGRGDILLLRGVTNRWAVKWERDQGGGVQPVDLTDYTCRFEMRLPGGDAIIYSQDCDAHGLDGVAAVYIPPAAFTNPVWAGRTSGEWRITASRSVSTELLGWGYWTFS